MVISLDAHWGEGKSTFVEMWKALLKKDEKEIVLFDAFKNDFSDEPF